MSETRPPSSVSRQERRLQQLRSPDAQQRRSAALALGGSGDLRALEPLVEAWRQERKEWVWSAMAEALQRLGDPRAVDLLLACLEEEDVALRRKALEALGVLGDSRAVDAVIACLRDQDMDVRYHAAWA